MTSNKKSLIMGVSLVFLLFCLSGLLNLVYKNMTTYNEVSLQNYLNKKYPYIYNPISCEGLSELEYKKRYENRSRYHDSEIYINSYKNKWDQNVSSQKFNVLQNISSNDKWVQPYRNKYTANNFDTHNYPAEAMLRNYLEELDIRYKAFDISGRGYFLFDDGYVVTLTSRYSFTENAAKIRGECFDNGNRVLNIITQGYGYSASASNITGDLAFSSLIPQYCYAYSFLNSSGDLFIICLSEKVSADEFKMLILGYSQDKDQNTLVPVLKEVITENQSIKSFPYFKSNYMSIIQNQAGNYYIFAKTQVLEIKPDDNGYLQATKINVPESDQLMSIYFPNKYFVNDYTLPYVFVYYTSIGDHPGTIFDLNTGNFLEVDYESCVVSSPENFYNKKVEPFTAGPYKSMSYKIISANHIQVSQSSLNAGCVTDEGIIDVYINNDKVTCDIKIVGENFCD